MKKNEMQMAVIILIFVNAFVGMVHGQSGPGDFQTQANAKSSGPFSPLGQPNDDNWKTQATSTTNASVGNQQIDRNGKLKEPQQPYRLTGRYHLQEGSTSGYLVLQVELVEGAYIHSLTQDKEMNPSVISVKPSSELQTKSSFQPDRNPTVIEKDPVFDCRMEKHSGKIQFFVPIELLPGTDLQTFQPAMTFSGQVCTNDGVCIPLRNQTVPAKFSGFYQKTASKENTQQKETPR